MPHRSARRCPHEASSRSRPSNAAPQRRRRATSSDCPPQVSCATATARLCWAECFAREHRGVTTPCTPRLELARRASRACAPYTDVKSASSTGASARSAFPGRSTPPSRADPPPQASPHSPLPLPLPPRDNNLRPRYSPVTRRPYLPKCELGRAGPGRKHHDAAGHVPRDNAVSNHHRCHLETGPKARRSSAGARGLSRGDRGVIARQPSSRQLSRSSPLDRRDQRGDSYDATG